MNRFIQAPAKPVPDFVLTTVMDGVERETVFMDCLMLVINDVFDSAVVLDRPTIIVDNLPAEIAQCVPGIAVGSEETIGSQRQCSIPRPSGDWCHVDARLGAR